MKHTPGPWSINEYGKVVGPDKETVSINGVSMPCGFVPPQDVSNANARLVAAAPELLEALREARCWIRFGDNGTPAQRGAKCSTAYEAHSMIVAAIAKAEGRG